MFHKRDDRLQRLNEELLAEEEEYFDEYEDEYEDEDDLSEEDLADLLGHEAEDMEEFCPQPNFATHYRKGSPTRFDDDEFDEEEYLQDEEFLYRDDYKSAKKAKKKADRAERKEKRKKLGLAIIALVELIAIGGILAWWLSWML